VNSLASIADAECPASELCTAAFESETTNALNQQPVAKKYWMLN
jgi:hypothetical protein